MTARRKGAEKISINVAADEESGRCYVNIYGDGITLQLQAERVEVTDLRKPAGKGRALDLSQGG